MFHVDSEVGRLRQVILHRPDLELKRLTPDNVADLLFDDMLWVSRAQAEHDAFAGVLRSRGVVVHYYSDLLAQTLDNPEARAYVLDRLFDPRRHGPLAAETLRAAMEGLGSAELARHLAGGITKREIAELGPVPRSIAFHSLDSDGFVLAPLPNLLYQRDTSCWIYGGVSINAMRHPARIPESISDEAIYRWHPMFAAANFDIWYHGAEAAPATIEGGDVLVIGDGAVLVGMSERTTPQAVEMLASRLFAVGSARCLVAIDMPKARAFMHLDTMLTMAGYGVFTKYAGMGMLPTAPRRGTDAGDQLVRMEIRPVEADRHACLEADHQLSGLGLGDPGQAVHVVRRRGPRDPRWRRTRSPCPTGCRRWSRAWPWSR